MKNKTIAIVTGVIIGLGFGWALLHRNPTEAAHEGREAPASGLADVDGDGWVTESDVQTIKDAYLMLVTLTDDQFSRADVNQDGEIGIDDYLMAKRYLIGDLDL